MVGGMKWIKTTEIATSASGKTSIWDVHTLDRAWLGQVKWFGPWRKYAYFPLSGTLYEPDCLRDLAQFCEDSTRAHRDAKKDWS